MNKFTILFLSLMFCGLVEASVTNLESYNYDSDEFTTELSSGLEFDSCPILVSPAPPAFFAPMSYCQGVVPGYRCFVLGKDPNCPSYCVCRPK